MYSISPVWRVRLRTAFQVRDLLLQTFVIHPAFLLLSHHAGSSGEMLLRQAENLVRDAPDGKVWDCRTPTAEGGTTRQELSLPPHAMTPDNIRATPAPAVAPCVNVVVRREDWVSGMNSVLLSLYLCGVVFSVIASLAIRGIHRRAQRGNS
ncbi:hypothetical protein SC171_16610 [Pantoea cypripedii]|uniref:hypothetical protein n=1 Tax=Pantoea cypripedii TaxID=55209 RepID=UPI002FCC21C2